MDINRLERITDTDMLFRYIPAGLGSTGHYGIRLPDRELACAPIGSPVAR